jgi:hypothetical protein
MRYCGHQWTRKSVSYTATACYLHKSDCEEGSTSTKKIEELSSQVDQVSIKKASLNTIQNKCKGLYRAPETAICDMLNEFVKLDWNVCRCTFQADSHIAEMCRESGGEDVAVLTNDSDMLVYEHINTMTMPVGRGREFTTFNKADVMAALDLPVSL